MGLLRLCDFRDLLSRSSGKGFGNPILDLYINLGYIEVQSARNLDHEALKHVATIDTVEGQTGYALPSNFLGISAIFDSTSKKLVLKTDLDNLQRYNPDSTGRPQLFALSGDGIEVWPSPDKVYTIRGIYFETAALLDSDEDVTVLPATWDNAIFLLSVHYAKASVDGLDEEAHRWYVRAVQYMDSRATDADFSAGAPAMPITVARSFDDLVNMRNTL